MSQLTKLIIIFAATVAAAVAYPIYSNSLMARLWPGMGPVVNVAGLGSFDTALMACTGGALAFASMWAGLEARSGNLHRAHQLARMAGVAGLGVSLPFFLLFAWEFAFIEGPSGRPPTWPRWLAEMFVLLAGPYLIVPWSLLLLFCSHNLNRTIRRQKLDSASR